MTEQVQDTNTTTTLAPDAGQTTPPAQDAGGQAAATPQNMDQLPEWARKLVSELRGENAKHRKAATDAEKAAEAAATAAAAEQGKYKELFDAAQKKLADAEAKAQRLELDALKSKVAGAVGLPAGLAARLAGETEEAITADAQALLAALPKVTATNDASAGTGGATSAAVGRTPEDIAAFAARMGIDPKYVKPEMFTVPKKG